MDPNMLMYMLDDKKEINGEKLHFIAIQYGRRFWNKGKIKNYIYRIGNSRMFVY